MRLIDADALFVEIENDYKNANGMRRRGLSEALDGIADAPTIDAVPVVRGRWVEYGNYPDDAYYHHKCSNCNTAAPFDYKYREDWDEGMDGEWYSLGMIDDGINEHLTTYCPNCGARMDSDGNG